MEDPSYLEYLLFVILSILSVLGVRFALGFAKQTQAITYHHTMSYILLPPITMVITTLIAGNIALSLGMIGALSIVRFRHPVKSAPELVMYFDLITIGIATSVRTKWAIHLIIVVLAIIFGVKLVQKIAKKYNKSFFTLSFNEGVSLNMLEVHSSEKIDIVEKNENIKVIIKHPDQNQFVYRLAFENKQQLDLVKEQLEKIKNIKKIDINYI